MKEKEDPIAALLAGMPQPKKAKRVVKRKHFSTRNVPLDVAIRRLISEELGEAEPTREQKSALLQKYGILAARIDRRITKPYWIGEREWRQRLSNWYKMTKGLVERFQPRRPQHPNQGQPQKHQGFKTKPWSHKKGNQQHRPTTPTTRPNSGPTRTGSSQR